MELISTKDPICGSLPPILQYVYQSSSEKFFGNDGTLGTEPEEEWELHHASELYICWGTIPPDFHPDNVEGVTENWAILLDLGLRWLSSPCRIFIIIIIIIRYELFFFCVSYFKPWATQGHLRPDVL